MTLLILCCAVLAAAVGTLLVPEWRKSPTGILVTKPAASAMFVVIAVVSGAPESLFGQLVLLGLVLSWFGDVFLIGKRNGAFAAGLAAFLLAHIAYTAAFLTQSLQPLPMAVAAAAMGLVAAAVLRWLWPGLPRPLRLPVIAYVIAIAVMVVTAAGTVADRGPGLLAAAAVFAASDVFVARERFVHSTVANRLLGLPLYYGAQLMLALSVAAA